MKAVTGKRLTRAEVNAMLKTTKRIRDIVLVGLLWKTGAKPNEVLALRKEDIKIEERQITVKLPSRERIYERPRLIYGHSENSFLELLVRYVNETKGKLFPISRQMLRIIVRDMGMKALGIPVCLHNIKRSKHEIWKMQREAGILKRYNEKS